MRRAVTALALLAACGSSGDGPKDAHVNLDAPNHAGAGNGGGILSELRFAVVGDTRPANVDDTAHYPTDIVQKIWADVEAESPHPQLAVTTGDYIFASKASEVDAQLDLYLGARAAYTGVVYPTMGNHECDASTNGNCGPDGSVGEPPNYTEYLHKLVEPLGETRPYFVERFAAADASWTAKFLFIAGNAWNAQEAAWFDAVLGEPTTYTFVVRHEPHYSELAPGVDPSLDIMTHHPLTLVITGHTHTYEHVPAYREIIVGTGGAPLAGSVNYGYVIISRQLDGSLQETVYDYATHATVDHFIIGPDGDPR